MRNPITFFPFNNSMEMLSNCFCDYASERIMRKVRGKEEKEQNIEQQLNCWSRTLNCHCCCSPPPQEEQPTQKPSATTSYAYTISPYSYSPTTTMTTTISTRLVTKYVQKSFIWLWIYIFHGLLLLSFIGPCYSQGKYKI